MRRAGGIKVRHKGGRPYYYCCHDGVQKSLGSDLESATAAYAAILGRTDPLFAGGVSLSYCAVMFDADNTARLKPSTADWYKYEIDRFLAWLGTDKDMALDELKPHHLTRFVNSKRLNGGAGERNVVLALKRLTRWSKQQGYIKADPLDGVRTPSVNARDDSFDANELEWIIAVADDDVRPLILFAAITGLRMDECRRLESRHIDLGRGVIVFAKDEHKTGKRTGKPLVKTLTAQSLEIARDKIKAQGHGVLFQTAKGKPFSWSVLRHRLRRIGEKLKLNVVGSAFRKSYITQAILGGVDIESIRELVGHADLTMISRHYSKVGKHREHLREQAEKAIRWKAT